MTVVQPTIQCRQVNELAVKIDYNRVYFKEEGFSCWYCTLALEGRIYALPLKKRGKLVYRTFMTEEKNVQIYRTHQSSHEGYLIEGAFCCPSCVYSYIVECSAENVVRYRESRALLLESLGMERIEPSPDKRLLFHFFGPLSPREYRAMSPLKEVGGFSSTVSTRVESHHSSMNIPLTMVFCTN